MDLVILLVSNKRVKMLANMVITDDHKEIGKFALHNFAGLIAFGVGSITLGVD